MAAKRSGQGAASAKEVEEKKYSQFPRDSISRFAESCGVSDVSEQALSVLTEDVNYRLRELAQNGGQFMRHSKRRKLICEDVQRALRWSDTQPVYGCSGPDPLPFRYIREAEVYCPEDNSVDLLEELELQIDLPFPQEPSVKGRWLVVEGVPLNSKSNEGSKGTTSGSVHQNSGAESSGKSVLTSVTASHMQYYEEVTKALLGNDRHLVEAALEDLTSNTCLSPVLPYLVHFVSLGVRKLSHDLANLNCLLRTVHALANNPSLFLNTRPYPELLVQALLFCLLEPLAAALNPANDHWVLRDNAARLLASLLERWGDRLCSLKAQVLDALREPLREPGRPLCAQYGAILGLTFLGDTALRRGLCATLPSYWPQLERALLDSRPSSAQMQSDATKVHGALLLAAEKLMRHQLRQLPRSEIGPGSYGQLYECLGDALAVRLPTVNAGHLLYSPRPLFAQCPAQTRRDSPTGEQLLEALYEEERSPSAAEDDNNSEESGLSGPPVGLHPQVKSTISDPDRGIRLTIALRRTQEEPKPRRRRAPDPPEPPFETVPLRPRRTILICFEGATPLPRHSREESASFAESRVARLNRIMGRVGRRRKRGPQPIGRHLGVGLDAIL